MTESRKLDSIDWHTTREQLGPTNDELEGEFSSESDILEPDPDTGEPRVEILIDPTLEKAYQASEYLKGVLLNMGLSGRIATTIRLGSVYLEILGAEPGLVIGHRGQNLDALQHLVNRMVNRTTDNLIPVTVDSDNYRDRRHQQLEKMVNSYCHEVLDNGRSEITDPMTPSERRLFHIAANRFKGIKTISFGSGFFQPIKVYPAYSGDNSDGYDEESRRNRNDSMEESSTREDLYGSPVKESNPPCPE